MHQGVAEPLLEAARSALREASVNEERWTELYALVLKRYCREEQDVNQAPSEESKALARAERDRWAKRLSTLLEAESDRHRVELLRSWTTELEGGRFP